MTLAQEAENRFKKYEDLNVYYPSVMQVCEVPHSEVLAVQGQSSLHVNNLDSNQIQDMNEPGFNWKASLMCYKCGENGIYLENVHIQVVQQLLSHNRLQQ